jgi:hypothetical protein
MWSVSRAAAIRNGLRQPRRSSPDPMPPRDAHPMTIGPDSVVVRDNEPIATTLDDQVVMLSVRAGAYFGLNDIGSEIWEMIGQPRRVDDICHTLSRVYDMTEDTATRDVVEFLEALLARGLVRVVEQHEQPP